MAYSVTFKHQLTYQVQILTHAAGPACLPTNSQKQPCEQAADTRPSTCWLLGLLLLHQSKAREKNLKKPGRFPHRQSAVARKNIIVFVYIGPGSLSHLHANLIFCPTLAQLYLLYNRAMLPSSPLLLPLLLLLNDQSSHTFTHIAAAADVYTEMALGW